MHAFIRVCECTYVCSALVHNGGCVCARVQAGVHVAHVCCVGTAVCVCGVMTNPAQLACLQCMLCSWWSYAWGLMFPLLCGSRFFWRELPAHTTHISPSHIILLTCICGWLHHKKKDCFVWLLFFWKKLTSFFEKKTLVKYNFHATLAFSLVFFQRPPSCRQVHSWTFLCFFQKARNCCVECACMNWSLVPFMWWGVSPNFKNIIAVEVSSSLHMHTNKKKNRTLRNGYAYKQSNTYWKNPFSIFVGFKYCLKAFSKILVLSDFTWNFLKNRTLSVLSLTSSPFAFPLAVPPPFLALFSHFFTLSCLQLACTTNLDTT